MRPLRLDLAGFTVFRDETTIDFTDADFFVLVGPTGSGKSTVLDAICFALYGTVPRWGSTRGIAGALAPSANEARVRLVFESAGARYVATRVVRRDGRGNVKTGNAGLQRMPPGFDVTRLDTGLTPDDLGEVLAGTAAEMERAVLDAVGLPYEQFTTCVLLPQGQFADFLHARPATRQQILVNLLGLDVYERIRERAAARAAAAEAGGAAVDQMLAGLAGVDEEALAAAATRVRAVRDLTAAIDAAVPGLRRVELVATTAARAVAELDAEIALLGQVGPPDGVTAIATAVTDARARVADAASGVTLAEEREEKVRAELAAAGDATGMRLLLRAHEDRDRQVTEANALADGLAAAEAEHRAARQALERARVTAAEADEALDAARHAYQEAQAADRAAALRAHLVAGERCPVCTQPVGVVPPLAAGSRVAAAETAGHSARTEAEAARRTVAERERSTRDLERRVDRARAQYDQLTAALAESTAQLADSPGPDALRRGLAAVAALHGNLDEAGAAVRGAREAHRQSQRTVAAAEEKLRGGWADFDRARDAVARLGPPVADRADLAVAWTVLADWTGTRRDERQGDRSAAAAALDAAHTTARDAAAGIEELFAVAGLAVPQPADATGYAHAATLAVERAEAEHHRLADRWEQVRHLRRQRAGQDRQAQLARTLAGHLRANNFERWLLAEALDLLVEGASGILRELSGGQYELVHDKGEFFVVDHHDAGLRRGVRTLSGGETFQASLALALALSEQLAGMSTTAASLESIVLDEGFGSLDTTTLDTVAATLESLAARGDRMVGLVTHVPALAERVPVRFEVSKDTRTARVERTGL